VVTETLYEALGGEAKLRDVIDDFVERVFADIMIGFFFASADKARIKRFEFEHASALPGGRNLQAARCARPRPPIRADTSPDVCRFCDSTRCPWSPSGRWLA
jgi:truncated hemoglobin YjbI